MVYIQSLGPGLERDACSVIFAQCISRGPVSVTLSDNVLVPSRVEIILVASVSSSVSDVVGMVAPRLAANLHSSLQVCLYNM